MKKKMDVMCCCGILIMVTLAAFANVLAAEAPSDKLAGRPDDTPASSRPNILWLIAEDCGPDLGCYGNRFARSPNLDRLATEGIRYTRAYTTSPVCSPARSAFMTGMYQTSIGAQHHRSHRGPGSRGIAGTGEMMLPAGVKILSDWMREAGYFTCNATKFTKQSNIIGTGKTDWNFTYRGKPFDSNNWEDLKSHQPFFAQVNFQETHTPHKPAKHPVDPASISLPPYIPDHPVLRKFMADYYGAIENLDLQAGAVLKLLQDDGLAENTIVIFFGDNGREMSRGKGTLYDMGLHVPMIVRWPDRRNAGQVNSELISAIDLAPTSLSLAGAPIPETMQGQPFLGRNARRREYCIGARDRIEATVDRVRSVITDRYHYMRNFMPDRSYRPFSYDLPLLNPCTPVVRQLYNEGKLTPAQAILQAPQRPVEELYDLEADPHELNNLAESSGHQEVMSQMRSRLEAWMSETKDQGAVPEDPVIVERVTEQWNAWLKINTKK